MKECKKCGEVKEYSDFHKDKNLTDGYKKWCAVCANTYNKSKRKEHGSNRTRKYNVKRKYGISLEEYDNHLRTPCDICGESSEHLDHCHTTNKIRGGLCGSCNIMLGYSKENTDTLKSAIEYLEKHNV